MSFNEYFTKLVDYAETNKIYWHDTKYWQNVVTLWCKIAGLFDNDKEVSNKLNSFILGLEREFKGE